MNKDLVKIKKEFVFYYESRQNPNGDPGFENQPRMMPDNTILVTDVRLKRTIRDYAKNSLQKTIFVDYDKEGNPITADGRVKEILGSLQGDIVKGLLLKTFDTPLFGALVTIRSKESEESGSSKLTGPIQFGIGRSVNKVKVINPMISGRFVGKEAKSEKQFSTFGKFFSVEYALIKFQGIINPLNLDKYLMDEEVVKNFISSEGLFFECLWNGTNSLISRSKFPQRSVFYIEVDYSGAIYNDLSLLVDESSEMKSSATRLTQKPFIFNKLLQALHDRKSKVDQVRLASCREISDDVIALKDKLAQDGIKVSVIPTEEPKWSI